MNFPQERAPDEALRIISIGAHPDDCDVKMGGTAALWAERGHAVKFLSVTNGDAGHHEMGGGPLYRRRLAEAQEAARRLGIEYELLNIHDGELTPSLDVRRAIIRAIRTWEADLVIGHRPNDYHPDHRYAGVLVQDAAYLVLVPNVVPQVPPLQKNPVFLYMSDDFQKPNPFTPDVAVAIDATFEKKMAALDAHPSQVYEWLPWVSGTLEEIPAEGPARRAWLAETWSRPVLPGWRAALARWYGEERAEEVTHAEAFEVCEYGHQPSEAELRRLFPFFSLQ